MGRIGFLLTAVVASLCAVASVFSAYFTLKEARAYSQSSDGSRASMLARYQPQFVADFQMIERDVPKDANVYVAVGVNSGELVMFGVDKRRHVIPVSGLIRKVPSFCPTDGWLVFDDPRLFRRGDQTSGQKVFLRPPHLCQDR
jgi:hypothetical protein